MTHENDYLQNIQKIFRIFHALTRVAKTLCIVGASFCAVSALCITVAESGGQVFSLLGEPVDVLAGAADPRRMNAELSVTCIQLIAKAILLAFAQSYLQAEQADGTPFTKQGADRLRMLGICCIWIPIVAVVIAAVIAALQGVLVGDLGNRSELITGVILLLASTIFRYGAELEQKAALRE